MWQHTLTAIRRCIGTRRRRWLVAATLLVGAAVALGAPDRTLAGLSDPAQSLMSVTVPLLGILLVHDLHRSDNRARLTPTLLAAVLVAAGVGALGMLFCATGLAFKASAGAWDHAATIAAGGVLVQVLAQLVGTGMGLLLRSPWAAFPATFLPFAVWLALAPVAEWRWLTPYETARHLSSGQMSTQAWLQWLTVLLIWGVALNAFGAMRHAGRRRPGGASDGLSAPGAA
ncbi:hypothetical protein GCM10009827_007400 [Dactylosporangium maewongense]|uniref:Integral membrane protein n=1 Tax=Dactylosporangium maewongense TaxID=634393 RepID=A0ABN1ZLA5_9ACTN